MAQTTLWLMDASTNHSISVPHATRAPLQDPVWFNYLGQTAAWKRGTLDLPSKMARRIEQPNGTPAWTLSQQTYNPLGLPAISTDELGRQTRTTYFANNQDIDTESVLEGTTWQPIRSYANYSNHLPQTITQSSGLTTTIVWNAKSQPSLITQTKVSNNVSNTESFRFTYDTDGKDTPDGQPGHLMKVEATDPANSAGWVTVQSSTYDDYGRLRTRTDPTGYILTYDYDDFDRPTLITHPDGKFQQFAYDRLDLRAEKSLDGRWSRTYHNTLRQPILQIDPLGRTTAYEWCTCGDLYKLIDPMGRTTRWKRDALGRVQEKVLPDGTTKTSYTYQPLSGRLATITLPNDQGTGHPTLTRSYQIDGAFAKEDYFDPATPDVTYTTTTDPLGRLTQISDGTGLRNFTYHPLTVGTPGAGKPASDDGPLADDTLRFAYDWQDRPATTTLGNETTATNLNWTQSTTWDTLGRVKSLTNALGTFTYGYLTLLARPDSLTASAGLTTTFSYRPNADGSLVRQRLNSIANVMNGTPVSSHTYGQDASGRIGTWGQTTAGQPTREWSFGYDPVDQLTSAQRRDPTAAPGVLTEDQAWSYDPAGNWLSHASGTGPTATVQTSTHNALNQIDHTGGPGSTLVEGRVNEPSTVKVAGQPAALTPVPGSPGGFKFTRTIPTVIGQNTVLVEAKDLSNNTTTQNWLFTVPPASPVFIYDLNGNLKSDGTKTYTWDAQNRLTSATVNGTGQVYSWTYDYAHRRVSESLNANLSKRFIWNDTDLIQERNAATPSTAASITRSHLFGGFIDGSAALATTSAKYLTTHDHLGSVREVIASTGSVAAVYDYTPYQGPIKLSGAIDASLLTIGRYYHHAPTGLDLALYRGYDPAYGRWLSRDPIEEEGGVNLYGFVDNGPVDFFDLFGEMPDMPSYLKGIKNPSDAFRIANEKASCPNQAKAHFRQWQKGNHVRPSSVSKKANTKKPKGFKPGRTGGGAGLVGILLLVAEEAEAKAKENAEAKLFDEEISKGGMCNSATAEFLKRRKMQEDFAEFAKAAGGR